MKLAIVYDWLDKWGGAERILQTVYDAYPKADIYTLYYDQRGAVWAAKYRHRIQTSFLQKLYRFVPNKKYLTPLMPAAAESFVLNNYEVVLSISSSFAKGVLTRPETKHLSYIFAPTRFLWHEQKNYFKKIGAVGKSLLVFLREWDFIAATRPDNILTLSRYSRDNIQHVYRRNAIVLPPPFDLNYFAALEKKDRRPTNFEHTNYFLFVGRLEPYKRVDLLVQTFRNIKEWKLLIVGDGSERSGLYKSARGAKNIFFYQHISEPELAYVYKHSRALIMPQAEDFGYTALEALFFGKPVVSFAKSGTAEIIQHGVNGLLFFEQTQSGLTSAIEKFHTLSYNIDNSVVAMFAKENFLAKLKKYL